MTRHAASLVLLLTFVPTARAQEVGYSGMVRVADDAYLTVNDRKNTRDPGDRLGILTVSAKGSAFRPLSVADWRDPDDGEPSDLEAVCAVPGRPGEYLLGESGRYKKKYGRLFHVRVTRDAGGWKAECLKAFHLPRPAPDDEGTTWPGDEVEGMACISGTGTDVPTLVLGARGGQGRDGYQPAQLVWGDLDLTTYAFTRRGSHALGTVKGFQNERGCADLHVVQTDGGWEVWSVAVRDAGDTGPFHSAVYRPGVFTRFNGVLVFTADPRPAVRLHLHGLKVEALAAPPRCVPRAAFAVATDDENYGGLWRPLFPSP